MWVLLVLLATSASSFQLVPGSPFLTDQGTQVNGAQAAGIAEDARAWTEQPLCVLQASGTCPAGFTYQELRLSTQPDVNPKDRNVLGEELMHLGEAGRSSLIYDTYDRLYTLTLAVCCKV